MSVTGYPFEFSVEVAFRDVDAMGHVNNAVYFSFMETARFKYLVQFMPTSTVEDWARDFPLILAHASCDYKAPAKFGELLTIGVGVSRFGGKSFDLVYKIVGENGRLIAYGRSVQVMFDYQKNAAFPIPEKLKQAVLTFQGNWQPE